MKIFTNTSVKKMIALLCVLAVSVSGVVFAAFNLPMRYFTAVTVMEAGENTADVVKVYGNGVTFVSYEESIEIGEDIPIIQFYLPSGALTDTLTVDGINVVQITTNEERHPIIEEGDVITVYTEDASYLGTFLGWDNMLLLEINNRTIMIPGERIVKIILSEVVQTQGPKTLVQVTTDSLPGEYKLKISYLMRGPTWTPTYFLELETSFLECWATIENVETWNNFTLILVSGGPHIVYRGPILQPHISGREVYSFSTSSIDFTSNTMDEYHEYTHSTRLSFEKGTVVKLPLFNGTTDLRQEYFWENGEVQNRYHINNTLSEPLAAGIVEFYRGEAWVGEDDIPYTPVKGESIALVNYAYDIKVTSTVVKSIDETHHDIRGINITIRNPKTTKIQILIKQNINGYTLVTSTPPATRVGPTLSWVIDVDVDSTLTIYYEWEHYW